MGNTPVYNIRYADATTKANALAQALQNQALDTEAALLAAQIPPAQPMSIAVATTDAARDTFWGALPNEAARLALQAKGATTERPDKGWTERYYATYNAGTNPGGAAVAGWYPVAGRLPGGKAVRSASAAAAPSGAWTLLTNPAHWAEQQRHPSVAAFDGTWKAPVSGLYRISASVLLAGASTVLACLKLNNANADLGGSIATVAVPNVASTAPVSILADLVTLTAGDVLRVAVFPATAAMTWDTSATASSFGFTYLGPRAS